MTDQQRIHRIAAQTYAIWSIRFPTHDDASGSSPVPEFDTLEPALQKAWLEVASVALEVVAAESPS